MIHISEGNLNKQKLRLLKKRADKTQFLGIMSPLGKTQIW